MTGVCEYLERPGGVVYSHIYTDEQKLDNFFAINRAFYFLTFLSKSFLRTDSK